MSDYQVLARKYRPKTFSEVLGQDAIVTTLKNAIRQQRLAHAYLFCGSRGTGKTTLARLLAKALNCHQLSSECEPCNTCSSCREIIGGNSLDVIEIDGASHRGIDDVRQINDTVGYAASSGGYKIYIIDEVHMLTKEAFNALLKTLEEPPPRVIFFFATTEVHKILPTILSRCQRFNLNRIPLQTIIDKLHSITKELGIASDEEGLRLVASLAEGGLRDAESLLDQVISFQENGVTAESVSAVMGIMPRDILFELDQATGAGNLAMAFEIAHQIFAQGKDLIHFVESLTDHFRTLIQVKLAGNKTHFLELTEQDQAKYIESSKLYSREQCLYLLDELVTAQQQIRFASSPRIMLEAILLKILRSGQRISVDVLVRRLAELEQKFSGVTSSPSPMISTPVLQEKPRIVEQPVTQPPEVKKVEPPKPISVPAPAPVQIPMSITEDPIPSPADLGIKAAKVAAPKPAEVPASGPPVKTTSKHDTILQFAAIELEGRLERKR